jgi:hypothetical protein
MSDDNKSTVEGPDPLDPKSLEVVPPVGRSLDEEFDRKRVHTNPCNFSPATLRRRENEMKDLQRAYPNINPSWLEMAWSYCEYTPQEEQDRIVNEKLWEGPPLNRRVPGGVIKDAIVIEKKITA